MKFIPWYGDIQNEFSLPGNYWHILPILNISQLDQQIRDNAIHANDAALTRFFESVSCSSSTQTSFTTGKVNQRQLTYAYPFFVLYQLHTHCKNQIKQINFIIRHQIPLQEADTH